MKALITQEQADGVTQWHEEASGLPLSTGSPAAFFLKYLEEVFELGFACGCSPDQMSNVFISECDKARWRDEIHPDYADVTRVGEELADCTISLQALAGVSEAANVYVQEHIDRKLPVLKSRIWAVNEGGVLRRPGRKDHGA